MKNPLCKYNKCQAQAANSKSRCRPHLNLLNTQMRERAARLKQEGLCRNCRAPVSSESIVYCDKHLAMVRGKYKSVTHKCPHCKMVIAGRKKYCPLCQTWKNARAKARRVKILKFLHRAKRRNGLCVWCGRPAESGKSRCRPHLNLLNTQMRERAARLKQEGLCRNCRAPVSSESIVYCDKHLAMVRGKYKSVTHKCPHCKMVIAGRKKYCPLCQTWKNARAKARRVKILKFLHRAKRRNGLCVRCGRPAESGKSRCRPHLNEVNQQMHARYTRKPHLCRCGATLGFHRRLCDACNRKKRTSYIKAYVLYHCADRSD